VSYASVWRWAWTLVAAGGAGLAILEWSAPATAVVLVLLTAAIVGVESLFAGEAVIRRGVDNSMPHGITWALTIAAATTGLLALLAVSPPLALLLGLWAAVTSPPFVASLRRTTVRSNPKRTRPTRGSTSPASPASEAPGSVDLPLREQIEVSTMSDQQLFFLWRHTFWELRDKPDLANRVAVIALRQACLEELERRDPVALSAWLDSGGRASGGPERFWHKQSGKEDDDDA
jgi:hypothetical protein